MEIQQEKKSLKKLIVMKEKKVDARKRLSLAGGRAWKIPKSVCMLLGPRKALSGHLNIKNRHNNEKSSNARV